MADTQTTEAVSIDVTPVTASVEVVASNTVEVTQTPTVTVVPEVATTVEVTPIIPAAPEVEVPATPVIEPIVTTEVTTAPSVVAADTTIAIPQSDFDTLIAKLKESGSTHQKNLIHTLEKYIENMKPGMFVAHEAGVRHQYTLWKTITSICEEAPYEEFKKLWGILLAYFNTHSKGVFHERYIFRFAEHWAWDISELTAYQRILNLIKLTADPTTRTASMKQVNIDKTLSEGISEEARRRIHSFYQM